MNLFVDPRLYMGPDSAKLTQAAKNKRDDAALEQTCKEFEAVMVQMMFKTMRGSQPVEGIIDMGMAGEVYRDLYDGEVARELAHRQSMGLGHQLYRQLAVDEVTQE
ncbi:MAG: rod-binding protein [Desulfuromonadaceae bacterium]|nr:rod-binding protein [Desulfuromonadaceae bacterium]